MIQVYNIMMMIPKILKNTRNTSKHILRYLPLTLQSNKCALTNCSYIQNQYYLFTSSIVYNFSTDNKKPNDS